MSRHRRSSRPAHSRADARKHFSQNFLADAAAARTIVRASGITAGDLVLEIGPGGGMLTGQLLGVARRVLAYEIDPRYAAALRARYAGDDRIRCHHVDFRDVRAPAEPFAVVANIPFAASTDILRWCLTARELTSATLLTQQEFARKYSGDYQRWPKLTVTHWPTVRMSLGPRIGRDRFRPVPRVDAAVLHLRRRERPLLPDRDLARYRQLVDIGFLGVGGSLAASLATQLPSRRVRAAFARAAIATNAPVGSVAPDNWIALYRALS
ncbi:23S ribosomal RNA methyltransferase Erm [Nocardia shimofusensis]|uniref:23S ribosomal RNA methyltransferase Erm n=1 Tax=Nocardia shimofusensis TaxID=228596 RepID=UPI0008348BED|nr:23S ribosomal RNA methyltransferase Erm [Nocardia shimofusensis]